MSECELFSSVPGLLPYQQQWFSKGSGKMIVHVKPGRRFGISQWLRSRENQETEQQPPAQED
jgi:hypothetical protein